VVLPADSNFNERKLAAPLRRKVRNPEVAAHFSHRAPWLRRTSPSLSFPMTCSALNPFFILTPILILSPILTHPLDRFSGGGSNCWSPPSIWCEPTGTNLKRRLPVLSRRTGSSGTGLGTWCEWMKRDGFSIWIGLWTHSNTGAIAWPFQRSKFCRNIWRSSLPAWWRSG